MMSALLLVLAWLPSAFAGHLSLDGYLSQVRRGNSGIQGSSAGMEGSHARAEEGELLLAPYLSAQASYNSDLSPKVSPPAQGTKTTYDAFSLGLQKTWSFGLQSTLSYNVSKTTIAGANPLFLPMPSYVTARPELDLTMPLWSGLWGRSIRAQVEAVDAAAQATSKSEQFALATKLSQAESTYWRLAVARDILRVQKESLDRAVKIRDIQGSRFKLRLSEDSDLLQAEAALKLRTLDVQSAVDEERSARLAFNSARGITGDQVDDELETLIEFGKHIPAAPSHTGVRPDVESAYQQTLAVQANSKQAVERDKPTLEAYTTLSLNGLRSNYSTASSDALGTTYPNSTVGLRFRAPLDVATAVASRSGYEREIEGADLKYSRAAFEEKADWEDLERKYNEGIRRVQICRELEETQRLKYQNERSRQSRGKSTVFLVLQFEQDLASSQVTRLRTEGDLANTVAQMKIYSQ